MDVYLEFALIVIGIGGGFGVFTKWNIDRHKTKKLSKKKLRELQSNGK